jgi:hypothetical protein
MRVRSSGSAIRRATVGLLLLAGSLASDCSHDESLRFDFDFSRGTLGWVAGFADYPPAEAPIYRLEADDRPLPAPLDTSRSALYIAGTNRSDDLFMYYAGPAHVEPRTTYGVSFEVEIATAAPTGCAGVGGSPGESVYVKAGASAIEPEAVPDGTGYLRMNVDKGQQATGGANAIVLGDVANSRSCDEPPEWELKRLAGGSLSATSGDDGSLWLFVGTDSGYESRTEVYYTRVVARLDAVPGAGGMVP